jgi:tRNA A37 threonylcarbamoyladenosine dehydratase
MQDFENPALASEEAVDTVNSRVDTTDPVAYRFGGIQRLFGAAEFEKIRATRFAVVGIGGVGSWAAEALARTGASDLILVDFDEICLSNTNRQIHAMTSSHGQMKVSAMAKRILDIDPLSAVQEMALRFDADNCEEFFSLKPQVVIDASDGVRHKCLLLAECLKRGVKIITVGGAAGRVDPTQIKCADLAKTHGDPLLAKTRKILRQDFGFDRDFKKPMGIQAVFSAEPFRTTEGVCATGPLDCGNGLGTATFITGTFGFFASSLAIQAALSLPPP